jgi:hypothetical protein
MSACEVETETCEERSIRLKSKFFKTLDQSVVKIVKHNVQLDFFQTVEETQVDKLIRIVDEIRLSSNKVRKAMFARDCEKEKRITDLENRLAILERNICRGK